MNTLFVFGVPAICKHSSNCFLLMPSQGQDRQYNILSLSGIYTVNTQYLLVILTTCILLLLLVKYPQHQVERLFTMCIFVCGRGNKGMRGEIKLVRGEKRWAASCKLIEGACLICLMRWRELIFPASLRGSSGNSSSEPHRSHSITLIHNSEGKMKWERKRQGRMNWWNGIMSPY